MPTGYTADIAKGTSFKQYAMDCARAFGALVMLRDEPKGSPIPEEFKPSDYNERALKDAQKRLDKVKSMSAHQCIEEARKDYEKSLEYHTKGAKEEKTLRAKYEAMLQEVEKYTPPSPDHVGYKKFMKEQIEQSIDFDCTGYHEKALKNLKPPSGRDWKKQQVAQLLRDVEYNSKAQREENERTEKRNQWIKQLRESLNDHS